MPDTPLNPDALANLRLLADRATEEVRHAVIEPDILHKLLDVAEAVAQPVLDETALANLIAWKSLPFGATQFVKLDANAAHKVIELLKPHLAVAQPEVNTVEELDALPPCSVIVDKHGDAGLIEYGHVKFAETAKLPMNYVAKHYLPARVLYRPEVKP